MSLSADQQAVYQSLLRQPEGLNNAQIGLVLPQVRAADLGVLLNDLLSNAYITFDRDANGDLTWKAVDMKERDLLLQMDAHEKMIYSHVKAHGNQGIWLKDLIRDTNLHRNVATKTLKSMENKNIIKNVKSVKTPSKKIIMLFHLNPSTEITGGAWFTDNELDTEFVQNLVKVIAHYITQQCMRGHLASQASMPIYPPDMHPYPTAHDILDFITTSKLTEIQLELTDIKELLEMMIYDGKIVQVLGAGSGLQRGAKVPEMTYKLAPGHGQPLFAEHLSQVPCAHCPVYSSCQAVGPVTPITCQYFAKWLEF